MTKYFFLFGIILIQNICFSQEIDTNFREIDPVIIGTNKKEERKRSIAQQATTISSKELENANVANSADVLSNSGAVYVQKSQLGGGSVTIRGLEANRNLLVIDGIRMNNLIYRSGHLQNILTTDYNSFEKIEILSGPSSTIYGTDALGGVVSIYTKKPIFAYDEKQVFKTNILLRAANNKAINSHVNFNFGWKKIAFLTTFSSAFFGDLSSGKSKNAFYKTSYGERPWFVERINGIDSVIANPNRFSQVKSAYSQYDFMQKIAFKQSKFILHTLNFQLSNSSNINRYDRLTETSAGIPNFAEWYYGPQKRVLLSYHLTVFKERKYYDKIQLTTSGQLIEESRNSRNFQSTSLNSRVEKVKVFGMLLDFQKSIKKHEFSYGIDIQYNHLKSNAEEINIDSKVVSKLSTRYPDGKNNLFSLAVFIAHNWKINEKLRLVDGFRLGYSALNSEIKDTSFYPFPETIFTQKNPVYSGNIGLVYNVKNWKFNTLLSTGFRVPNTDDLAKIFDSQAGSIILPNADIRPEKTVGIDLGTSYYFNKKGYFENTLYYTFFQDIISSQKSTFNGNDSIVYDGVLSQVFMNQNAKNAVIYGFSSSFIYLVNDYIKTYASVSYTRGRINSDTSNVPLDHIPPMFGKVGVDVNFKQFSAQLFSTFNGWKRINDYSLNGEDNEQYATSKGTPAWFVVNFRASYILKLGFNTKLFDVTIYAGIDNILDTQYRTFASGINGAGRNFFFGLRYKI